MTTKQPTPQRAATPKEITIDEFLKGRQSTVLANAKKIEKVLRTKNQ